VAVTAARTVVIPPRSRDEDLVVTGVGEGTVTMTRTPDTSAPGSYSLWFDQDAGHARVGDIVDGDTGTVTRRLLAVDRGELLPGARGRLSGWLHLGPAEMGVPFDDVEISTPLGPAPAWLFPAPGDDWVIQVHGRAVLRQECLRAVPVFHQAGFSSLVVSYRNDGEAPDAVDGRYALGLQEWRDVDFALDEAVRRGARRIVLMGWSMGGAIVLQTLLHSRHRDRIAGAVLDSPVVDWRTALHFQGRLRRLPRPVRGLAFGMLGSRLSRITGLRHPIDLDALDLVARADELSVPLLVMHSEDDGFVPADASHRLAVARPDIVTYEGFRVARHTKLSNYDPERWNAAIRRWLELLR